MSDKSSSSGIGFSSLLLLAFIVLKLCHVIDWSWWWVMSPLWITAGIAIIMIGVYFLIEITSERRFKKRHFKDGVLKSKWQERLEQIQEEQRQKQKR